MRTARRTTVDRFRARVMLPVRDGTTGRLVGFTGRATPAAPPGSPRYLDSPTSADYAKGQHVHGLWEGRRRLADGAVPVLCEGAFDGHAVTLAGQGRYVGIAPSGTALTSDQVRALDRVAPLAGRRVVVAFDPDGPGQEGRAGRVPSPRRSRRPRRHGDTAGRPGPRRPGPGSGPGPAAGLPGRGTAAGGPRRH